MGKRFVLWCMNKVKMRSIKSLATISVTLLAQYRSNNINNGTENKVHGNKKTLFHSDNEFTIRSLMERQRM